MLGYLRRAAAGRAELLANPAIRAQILAGSIQTPHGLPRGLPHGLTNFNTFSVDFDTTPNNEGILAKFR